MAESAKRESQQATEASQGTVVGLLAEFENPAILMEAVRGVREAGYRFFDTHTPFPIHGMDRAMGLGPSKLGYMVLIGGATGLAIGLLMQWWMTGVDYPLWVGGKPFFALESSTPVTFELTILFAAIAAVAGMLALNKLPRPYNPLFNSEAFGRFSDNAFFLYIESRDVNFTADGAERLMRDLGALNTELVLEYEE